MGSGNVDAVFFDLDGVLVDATEWHYDALNRALALFGFEITRYEHLASYNGLPTRRKLEMLSVEKGLPRTLHSLISKVKQVYTTQEIQARCWPSFEKEYLLARLHREGYRMAVCSNAVRDSVHMMLERSGILGYFELVVSNEDVAKPKPDPEIYLETCRRMGLEPSRVVVVEDAPHGIEAARRAGTRVCEVTGFGDVDWMRVGGFVRLVEREASLPC